MLSNTFEWLNSHVSPSTETCQLPSNLSPYIQQAKQFKAHKTSGESIQEETFDWNLLEFILVDIVADS